MFGERLKEARLKMGMSQEALASVLFVSRQAVAKWENNINEPSIETIIKIADIFDINLDYLLKGMPVNKKSESRLKNTDYIPIDNSKRACNTNNIINGNNVAKIISIVFIILQYCAILIISFFFQSGIAGAIGYVLAVITFTFPFYLLVLRKHKIWAAVLGCVLSIVGLGGAIIAPLLNGGSSSSTAITTSVSLGIISSVLYIVAIVAAYRSKRVNRVAILQNSSSIFFNIEEINKKKSLSIKTIKEIHNNFLSKKNLFELCDIKEEENQYNFAINELDSYTIQKNDISYCLWFDSEVKQYNDFIVNLLTIAEKKEESEHSKETIITKVVIIVVSSCMIVTGIVAIIYIISQS